MKKFIIFILCFVLLISAVLVPEPIEVHAEENAAKEYYIEFLASSDFNKGSNKYQGYSGRMEFTLDKNIAMYCEMGSDTISVNTLILNSDGSYLEINDFLSNISKNVSGKKNFWYKKGSYEFFGGRSYEYYSLSEEKEGYINGRLYWKTATIEESGYLATNIPIFSNIASAKSYLEGNLSVKDAINYETDICNILYDLEVPKNLKITHVQNSGPNNYFNFTWEQTDPNYKNWKTEIYEYTDFRYRDSFLIFSWDDWKYVDDFFVTQTIIDTFKLKYTISGRSYQNNDELSDRISKLYPTEYGGMYEFTGSKLYFRNYYYDGNVRHYSNWVVVEFDVEQDTFINPEISTTVVEKNGSEIEIDDSGTPIQPDSDVKLDSDYTGELNSSFENVQSSDLISWIKNGFGLGGGNGVIAILSESFSFIPPEIWAVFTAGISIMVIVAIFKFIRG